MAVKQRDFSGRTSQVKASLKRLKDAKRLRENSRWRGAMYLAGYYIECKLKARLMEMYDTWSLEDLEDELSRRAGKPVKAFTHKIEVLMSFTGASKRMDRNARLWFAKCNRWDTEWRYDPGDGTKEDCDDFMEAVAEIGRFIDGNV